MEKEKKKILIIEDDSFLVSMYTAKFEMADFAVLSAGDGESGLKIALKEKPDVILLDIVLPKMDGFEVLKAIRANQATTATPVILLTNLSQKSEVEKGLAMGADDYLIKAHFMPSEVVEKIKEAIKN